MNLSQALLSIIYYNAIEWSYFFSYFLLFYVVIHFKLCMYMLLTVIYSLFLDACLTLHAVTCVSEQLVALHVFVEIKDLHAYVVL